MIIYGPVAVRGNATVRFTSRVPAPVRPAHVGPPSIQTPPPAHLHPTFHRHGAQRQSRGQRGLRAHHHGRHRRPRGGRPARREAGHGRRPKRHAPHGQAAGTAPQLQLHPHLWLRRRPDDDLGLHPELRQLHPPQRRSPRHDLGLRGHALRLRRCHPDHGRNELHGSDVWRAVSLGLRIRPASQPKAAELSRGMVLRSGLASRHRRPVLHRRNPSPRLDRSQRRNLCASPVARSVSDHRSGDGGSPLQHPVRPQATSSRRPHPHPPGLWLLCRAHSAVGVWPETALFCRVDRFQTGVGLALHGSRRARGMHRAHLRPDRSGFSCTYGGRSPGRLPHHPPRHGLHPHPQRHHRTRHGHHLRLLHRTHRSRAPAAIQLCLHRNLLQRDAIARRSNRHDLHHHDPHPLLRNQQRRHSLAPNVRFRPRPRPTLRLHPQLRPTRPRHPAQCRPRLLRLHRAPLPHQPRQLRHLQRHPFHRRRGTPDLLPHVHGLYPPQTNPRRTAPAPKIRPRNSTGMVCQRRGPRIPSARLHLCFLSPIKPPDSANDELGFGCIRRRGHRRDLVLHLLRETYLRPAGIAIGEGFMMSLFRVLPCCTWRARARKRKPHV